MSRKRIKWTDSSVTLEKAFDAFIASQLVKGVKEKTALSYRSHYMGLAKHINMELTFAELSKSDIDAMVLSMRKSELAHNSISSYLRVMKTFMNWSKAQGYTTLEVPAYKQVETVKEGYTDEELERLLKRPAASDSFCEYRNWVIVNFLLNSGCRAATIRNIQIQDVSLSTYQVIFRHTKNGKAQAIPLCSQMALILRNYMNVRKGKGEDYLFCNEYGGMLSENALRLAIKHYNHSRGVQKTSIHLFRHTFARKYLVDCGGNAFTLQRLLGHSTLKMTKHYCAIYDTDIVKNYDRFSPLEQMVKPKERIVRA